jgi:pimeloyl-ACP methyl ester carboxylesterase
MGSTTHGPDHDVIVAGVRSPLLTAGQPAGEGVVFVHGKPGSSRDWEDLVARVGRVGYAVAYDLPGFGRAQKPEGFDYSVPGYARHLEGVLRALAIRRVHLVLHDFGGPIGLAWAAMRPDQFASVTLINTGVLVGYRWHLLARIWRTPWLGELFQATATRRGFHLLLRRGNPQGLPRTFVDRMYDDYDRGTRRAVLRLYRSANDPGGMAAALRDALRRLDRSALVIWGAADPYIGREYAERQREAFPRSEVAILERSGHWPFIDAPEPVASLVVPFLERQLSSVT